MSEFRYLLPETILSVAGAVIMLLCPFLDRKDSKIPGILSGLALLAAGAVTVTGWHQNAAAFGGMVIIDAFSNLARLLIYAILFCISVSSINFLQREQIN